MDPRLRKMADVLVNYSVGAKPGQWIAIQTPIPGEPLAVACTEAILRAGAHPSVFFASEEVQEARLRLSNDDQLTFIAPTARLLLEQADATIAILAPRNTRSLSGIDPQQMAKSSKAMQVLGELQMTRTADGSFRWTIAAYPTPAGAQDANMSLRAYEDFVYGAGLLDEDDPIAAWRALAQRQQQLIGWLEGKREFHITGSGTDLRLSVEGRTWINDDGHFNFPGGEIFTAPVEDSVEGTIQFNFPAFYGGREVTGVRLVYRGGRVVEASATGDEAYLLQMIDLDENARRLGEFAIGTNPGIHDFTKNTLFDEKIGGTLHMALGRSIPGTGGENQSALHWDMVYNLRDGAEITVDGQLFSRNGEFAV
jgi:aminopeptidase